MANSAKQQPKHRTTKKTTTAEVRAVLARTLDKLDKGTILVKEAQAVATIANAVTANLSAEVKMHTIRIRLDQKVIEFGQLEID